MEGGGRGIGRGRTLQAGRATRNTLSLPWARDRTARTRRGRREFNAGPEAALAGTGVTQDARSPRSRSDPALTGSEKESILSRDGSKTDTALTFSSKRGQWAFTLDSPREKNSGNVSCYRIDIASVGGASVVVVAKLAPACSPPARVASKPGSRRRARSCGSARSVPRVDRASCRARAHRF